MARKTHINVAAPIDLRSKRHRNHPVRDHSEGRACRLAVVRPIAKTALVPGTVVWAHVPYEETDGWKLRPVVVDQRRGRDVTVFPGTTSDKRHLHSWAYRELTDLETAGLSRATGIELAAVTIDITDIVSVAGTLGADDRMAVLGTADHHELTVAA